MSMALNGQSTSNFELYKPSLEDSPPDITSTNANWDIIDAELKRLGDVGLPKNINKKLPFTTASSEVKTIYLSPNGADFTGDGSQEKPFKSISMAIAKFGGTARLLLRFAGGIYTETNPIEVSGCTSVEFGEDGSNPGAITLNINYYQHGGIFIANDITFISSSDTTHNTLSFYGATVSIEHCTFEATKNAAIAFRNGSQGLVINSTFNRCGYVIYAMGGSLASVQSISGFDNTYGYYSAGAVITVGSSTVEATTLASKAAGGVIFRGGNLFGTTANTFVNAT